MGLVAAQARFLMLSAFKQDKELENQMVNQQRIALANAMNQLFTAFTNLDPNSPQAQMLQMKLKAYQEMDKKLEMLSDDVDEKIVNTELAAVQKVIDKNIDMSFKTFA